MQIWLCSCYGVYASVILFFHAGYVSYTAQVLYIHTPTATSVSMLDSKKSRCMRIGWWVVNIWSTEANLIDRSPVAVHNTVEHVSSWVDMRLEERGDNRFNGWRRQGKTTLLIEQISIDRQDTVYPDGDAAMRWLCGIVAKLLFFYCVRSTPYSVYPYRESRGLLLSGNSK